MCFRVSGVKIGIGKWFENFEKMLRECGVELVLYLGGVVIFVSICFCSYFMLEELGYVFVLKLMSFFMFR